MGKKLLLFVLALGALVTGSAVTRGAPLPPAAPSASVFRAAPVSRAYLGRYGPYATLRRANEVARQLRARGYDARVVYLGSLYLGTRSYAVKVWAR